MVINVWLECLDAAPNENHCVLAIGDNTSAIGWLYRTSRIEIALRAHEAHHLVARKLAELVIEHVICIASQHIKGKHNVVADLLSFAGENERGKAHPLVYDYPTDAELTPSNGFTHTGTLQFRDMEPAQRGVILSCIDAANRCVIFDLCQVGRNESSDRLWRRWKGYCGLIGINSDTFLISVSTEVKDVVTKAFLQFFRTAKWNTDGTVAHGTRKQAVVGNTVRQAASHHLATTFRDNNVPSPLHVQGSPNMRPFERALFRAFNNQDPPQESTNSSDTQTPASNVYNVGGRHRKNTRLNFRHRN